MGVISNCISELGELPSERIWLVVAQKRVRCKCCPAGLACGDIISQRLELDGLLALGVLEQAQTGADNFTDVVVAAAFNLVADEGLKMRAKATLVGMTPS
jgi:hypothetical protein